MKYLFFIIATMIVNMAIAQNRLVEQKKNSNHIQIALIWESKTDEYNLTSLIQKYNMEILCLDLKTELPPGKFFPFQNLQIICDSYNRKGMKDWRMFSLMQKLFAASKIKSIGRYYTIKSKAKKNSNILYSRENDKHRLVITINKDAQAYKNTMTAVLKITSKKKQISKYIMQKKLFNHSKHIFSYHDYLSRFPKK